ncbi:hypothetical protein L1987_11828 [Smallanthus sonchifolius]|uniref:Uncharacterized protein n=1 Tax=Smallanthus sonchifolius TaxID=185202 RepID=A0ACB9JEB2_9ASTR|nr:hypothetical protein L1987_11828 [Smallanthus sonchifolius]
MLLACRDKDQIKATKEMLMAEFEMKELGEAKKILGSEIYRDRKVGILKLSQGSYIKKVLGNFFMGQSKCVATPLAMHFKLSSNDSLQKDEEVKQMLDVPYANALGSLMYLMVCIMPDLGFDVSVNRDVGRLFGYCSGQNPVVQSYVDSDFAKDYDRGRSINGYVFQVFDGVVSWKASLQHVVALPTTEAEFIALTKGVKEAMWLKSFLTELGVEVGETLVKCDNIGAIQLSKHQVFHERSKHINVKFHFVRDVINSKVVKVAYVNTNENLVDMLTKTLPSSKFGYCCNLLQIC